MGKMKKGNEALAEAALRAGLEYYAGYPITPQNEIIEYLSWRMPELDRQVFQAESEIAAINMLFGAAATGLRCMTSSSGPGISLKQEGISYLSANNLPCVIVNVQRWGAGLGSLSSAQTDYLRETRGGGNGDYRNIVWAPATIQETVDLMYEAFDKAFEYRNPLIILSEANLGQMMEQCAFPPFKEIPSRPDWCFNGKKKPHVYLSRIGVGPGVTRQDALVAKHKAMQAREQRHEAYFLDDAEYVFVAFGLPARVARDAVDALRADGVKAGLLRPISLWPFPVDAFRSLGSQVKAFISVESTDMGQLVEDIALASKQVCNRPVYLCASGDAVPSQQQVTGTFERILDGSIKEVY